MLFSISSIQDSINEQTISCKNLNVEDEDVELFMDM